MGSTDILDGWDDDTPISSHDWNVEQVLKQHGRAIFDFWHFLHDFPMLGLTHPIGRKIIRELKKSPKIILDQSHWFRASIEREFLLSRPPHELVSEKRYNSGGQPYLYLSNNAKCAIAEVTHYKKIKTAWVQRFQVERLENVLDLRPWNDEDENVDEKDGRYSPFLMALIFCDLLTQCPEHYFNKEDDKEIKWKCAYLMTRFIADAAHYCGFSGVLYSSVRFPRQNLVVFDYDWIPKADGDSYEICLTPEDLIAEGNFVFNQGERSFVLSGN
jgi:hypothetical protein